MAMNVAEKLDIMPAPRALFWLDPKSGFKESSKDERDVFLAQVQRTSRKQQMGDKPLHQSTLRKRRACTQQISFSIGFAQRSNVGRILASDEKVRQQRQGAPSA